MSRMGRSSSTSMGTLVLWIHVLVQRCRSRTYEFLQAEHVLDTGPPAASGFMPPG